MIKKYHEILLKRPSKGEVRRAGDVLKRYYEKTSVPEFSTSHQDYKSYKAALGVAQQWRSLHMYPLNTFQALLRQKLRAMGIALPLVAQRLKRMPTIINKLSRMQGTLETMQDIGGIRVVLADMAVLRTFEKKLRTSRFKHELVRERDYIQLPKNDGYRGVHLIYRCYSAKAPQEVQGLTIELQIRSKLQHFWATAVEAVDMFYGKSLKTGKQEKDWSDFFELASAAFALREGTALPAACSELTAIQIKKRLFTLSQKINAIAAFEGMQSITGKLRRDQSDTQYHLLWFMRDEGEKPHFTHLALRNKEEAERIYDAMEERLKNTSDDVVLVSARTEDLEKLYSNYFLNVDGFLKALKQAMA